MPSNFSCIIVDDEQDAIEFLRDMVTQLFKNIQVTGTYSYWDDALEALRTRGSDLVFMDISLPGKSGLDLLRLMPNLQSEIIFVTAYEQYALDAFAFSTSGYILKPVSDVALSVAVNNALERIQNKKIAKQPAASPAQMVNDKIGIPNNHGIDYVNIRDILYLESLNRCTKIVTTKAEYVSSYHMAKFKDQVEGHQFFQVHRSYLINLNFILRYEISGIVIMDNKMEIPVSRNVKNDFLKIFNSF